MVIGRTMAWACVVIVCGLAVACDDKKSANKGSSGSSGSSGSAGGTSTDTTSTDAGGTATASSGAVPWNTVDGTMAAYFKEPAKAAADAAPVPPLAELVGEWRATVTRVEFSEDPSGVALSVPEIPPFSFSIKREGDGFVMAPGEGHGSPRALKATATGFVAGGGVSDGRAPVELRYVDGALEGTLPLVRPVTGKAGFHAVRNHR